MATRKQVCSMPKGNVIEGSCTSLPPTMKIMYFDTNSKFNWSHSRVPGVPQEPQVPYLSGTGFLGTVPHQLGNLSKLQYLDLSRMSDTNSLDVPWLTCLPFLKYLDLSYLGLSTVTDWPHVVMIPFSKGS